MIHALEIPAELLFESKPIGFDDFLAVATTLQ
jgi:hypothetical protein